MKQKKGQYRAAKTTGLRIRTLHFKRLIGVLLILSVVLSASACVDLSAIREFSASATEVGKRFPNLANDLVASCKRQHVYQELSKAHFDPMRLVEISHPSEDSAQAKWLDEQCKLSNDAAQSLIEANEILITYLKTLGDLASDELTSFEKGFDGLATSFTGANIFNEPEVNAFKSLVGFVVKAATDHYRRKKLKEALETQNDNIQKVTSSLERNVDKYLFQLEANERVQLRSYYSTSILKYREYMRRVVLNAGAKPGEIEDPLPVIQVKRLWDDEEIALADKIAAAKAYEQALETVAQGHQKLYETRNDLGSKAVLTIALSYAETLQSIVEDFRKAF